MMKGLAGTRMIRGAICNNARAELLLNTACLLFRAHCFKCASSQLVNLRESIPQIPKTRGFNLHNSTEGRSQDIFRGTQNITNLAFLLSQKSHAMKGKDYVVIPCRTLTDTFDSHPPPPPFFRFEKLFERNQLSCLLFFSTIAYFPSVYAYIFCFCFY